MAVAGTADARFSGSHFTRHRTLAAFLILWPTHIRSCLILYALLTHHLLSLLTNYFRNPSKYPTGPCVAGADDGDSDLVKPTVAFLHDASYV